MTEPLLPTTASPHAAHDQMLIAALAARAPDLTEVQMSTAREQLASCVTCTDLLADLVALQTALPTTSTPSRPRDFQLTPADAARLRRDGWRRVLGFFGSARDSFSRPLAIGFTTLGLAGLLVAALPTMYGAGGAATILSTVGNPVGQAAPAAGEAYGTERQSMRVAPGASTDGGGGVFDGGNPDELGASPDVAGDASLLSPRDEASGLSAMVAVAGTLLIVGIGLFALRWSARRLL